MSASTHPLWRPFDQPTDEQIADVRVGTPLPTAVEVVAPDPGWPAAFLRLHERLTSALGDRALHLEHVGSTSVSDLWAKPMIDVDLTVADSGDEPAWLPDLEAAGLTLRVREPKWEEHRCLRVQEPLGNVHVFSPGAREPQRHRMFRDWLIAHADDRVRYGDLKSALAQRGFSDAMHYNNAKAALVYDIYERIFADDLDHDHHPQPR